VESHACACRVRDAGSPDRGALWQPGLCPGGPRGPRTPDAQVVLAGIDRVAVDAVGVALLRHHGTTPEVSAGRIFEQEQLKRAVELNLGVGSPDHIELITGDAESAKYAEAIRAMLAS
jgi:uncharacterized protein (DUF362 family)